MSEATEQPATALQELPEGWYWSTFDQIGIWKGGGTPTKRNPAFWDEGSIPWFSPKDIKTRYLTLSEDKITPLAVELSSTKPVNAGSILFVVRSGILRRIMPVGILKVDGTVNQDLRALTPDEPQLSRFLYYFAEGQNKEIRSSCMKAGTTVESIDVPRLESYPVPLPPLPEQIRIADKLDTLLARVDAGRERLERVPRLIKQFRRAVLSAAMSGDLTRDWRGGGNPQWDETTIGSLATDIRYGTAQKCDYDASGTPVLRIPNVNGGRINTDDLKFGKFEEKELKKLILRAGDLLMIRSNGSADLVGQPALVGEKHEGYLFAGYLIRLRLRDEASPEFVWHRLSAPDVRGAIETSARSSSGVHNINAEEIREITFDLPPLPEQAEIVRRVEALFAIADRIEAKYAAALSSFDRLTPALLAKAFRGELVPQDPNDEPASVLLERIQAQRAATPGKAKRGRPAKAATESAPEGEAAPARRRGRPRKAESAATKPADAGDIPQAGSFDDAVRLLEERKLAGRQ